MSVERRYAFAGALLGLGAPAGLLLLRWLIAGVPPPTTFVRGEISGDPALYAYLGVATVAAFALFGWVLGAFERRVESLMLTDPLTGLWNRRHFDLRLREELGRARRYSAPLALLILDVDRFKRVNDRFGHPEGDRVLQLLSSMIRDGFRRSDVVCRFGGEEIAILAPNTGIDEALALAERTRERISQTVIPLAGEPYRITISVGLAAVRADDTPEALLARADAALYAAKQDGRNACRVGAAA